MCRNNKLRYKGVRAGLHDGLCASVNRFGESVAFRHTPSALWVLSGVLIYRVLHASVCVQIMKVWKKYDSTTQNYGMAFKLVYHLNLLLFYLLAFRSVLTRNTNIMSADCHTKRACECNKKITDSCTFYGMRNILVVFLFRIRVHSLWGASIIFARGKWIIEIYTLRIIPGPFDVGHGQSDQCDGVGVRQGRNVSPGNGAVWSGVHLSRDTYHIMTVRWWISRWM